MTMEVLGISEPEILMTDCFREKFLIGKYALPETILTGLHVGLRGRADEGRRQTEVR